MANGRISTVVAHRWRFFRRYLIDPTTVGAVGPSSRALAAALCAPLQRCTRPVRILEVGAGTGAVTGHLGTIIKENDKLDICEVSAEFAEILARDVLTRSDLATAVARGRVRLLNVSVQSLTDDESYDFVISGLPFTAFPLRDVHDVFKVIRRCLRPGGTFSYFEYVALRNVSTMLAVGRGRRRRRLVSAYLSEQIAKHQIDRRIVVANLPPAHVRHLRFDSDG